MAEVETLHSETDFDPEVYIDSLYTSFTGDTPEDGFIKFVLDSLHEVYKDGTIKGERLLDIGSGPVSHGVYAASRWFKEIVLSDLSNDNLAMLRKWKAGDIRHQETVFKYMMQLERNKDDWVKCNRKLAKKVTEIIHSDLHQTNPISGTCLETMTFDALSLTLCQNAASPTEAQYRKCVQNYSRLLKPNGHLVVVDLLGEDFYTIGKHKFKVLHATKEMIHRIYTEAGYQILHWKQAETDQYLKYPPFAMVAKKGQ